MGKSEKKYGKGRLDHYYRLAKEKGYRARSSFKIIQLNQKYGFFTAPRKGRPMCVIDLCAAPGSWCQVATQCVPPQSLIVGVDLAPIKPLPNVITFQSDITTDHCRSQLRGYLKTWKADVVMHDGAPNVGMAWAQDAFTQSELVLQSLKLAVEFLAPGGWFITKVFRSKDYNKLMWVFQQFFDKCEATKPPSSRNVSAEIFVVCRGFKAPAKVDPKMLNPVYVFEELQENVSNNQQKVYNPEKKTRKRQGYENDEGKLVLVQKVSAVDFIHCEDPIQMLGESTEFTWDKEDPEIKQVKQLPQTTKELVECFKDLKVLGKKDFRMLLRWRKAARKLLKLDEPEESDKEDAAPLSVDEQIEREMENLTEAQRRRIKRERRRRNEQRQKEIYRMQVQNGSVNDIIAEHNVGNQDGLFDLNRVRRAGQADALIRGKQQAPVLAKSHGDLDIVLGDEDDMMVDEIPEEESDDNENSDDQQVPSDYDEDDANEELAAQLDHMYATYKEQQAKSAEARALRNRETEWHGIESADEKNSDDDDSMDSDDASDMEHENALSGRAAMFFDNPLFSKLQTIDSESDAGDSDDEDGNKRTGSASSGSASGSTSGSASSSSAAAAGEEEEAEAAGDERPKSSLEVFNEGQTDPTEQAIRMTLAQQLALGHISRHDLVNEGYNKVAFRDKDELPEWFVEDEKKHTRYLKPITKEASQAAKEAAKALNARPIKKVLEAKGRKQMRAHRRLERIRKKSDLINEDSNMSEREKSEEIAKLLRRSAAKKTRPKVTVVKASGQNKGLSGRPRGVKGKYKMVDGTMKKEQRALRRIDKKRRRK